MAHLAHYREAHPIQFVVTHWINLVAMVLLIVTGFLVHYPVPGTMGIARGLHLFFGFVLFANCLARVIMAFFVKSAPTGGTRKQVTDIKTWLPQKDNRHQALAWIKYYLFLKRDHPLSAKLGVPQKISYLMIPVLIALMFYSGLCLWGTTAQIPLFAVGTDLVGGPMAMRIIHFFGMFVFIMFMFIHVYLANVEGFAPSNLMFFHKEHGGLVYDPDRHAIVGEDDLGHGHDDDQEPARA
ncbi:cytochrome B [Berryella wangjianweii]|uniref:Cytochrome B n=1 Tax=Berryella wangjianweii TaxID=2734634 RepID=A0A6M8IWY6_9ACTN|nr:cytochrome b/b6 domain-containing protein [Berryella wangjianweii]NPD32168.1 cytochrome B [Eggerthellaceae bacterium zg-997]QKF07265.1 cytochrome B [Berryella wangjianweii]